MPKIISDIKKEKMAEAFKEGISFEDLTIQFDLKKNTIIKHLKTIFGLKEYKRIEKERQVSNNENIIYETGVIKSNKMEEKNNLKNYTSSIDHAESNIDNLGIQDDFFELAPLNENFNFAERKDLTSLPLENFDFPSILYMIVDKNIELDISFISDFPEYSFLPDDDQSLKTIKLFPDKKSASLFCKKNQRVIKVPNPNVFQLSASFLIKKGIKRIIYEDNLLSL